MWSASSSTTTSTRVRSAAPWSIRSISRPGVATTMSTPRSNALSCGPYGMPPATRVRLSPWIRASGASTSATCIASSRVGTSTRARAQPEGAFEPDRVVIIGSPKPSVLPDPVCPRPSTSRPASASGMVAAWIGNGWVMPPACRAETRALGTPSSAKPPEVGSAVVDVVDTSCDGASQLIWSDSGADDSPRPRSERSDRS